ncbi:hypothetical protein IAQ67_28615 (plasmid) [Paenibacillus peoriae]|uniref:Uncharacterized protein n=1 Tax=Paenibacillus peoriae TaxID=59893 RepID=A0A7H0YHB7_9BACL|nr:hypothetical protein [Paenibacillus peoriae]QNR70475.1 hypothetical protein IAQ67_28615 [Paenibacillus peoriae]
MKTSTNFKQAIIESTDGEQQVIKGQAFLGLTTTPSGEACEYGKQHGQEVTAAMIGSFDMASMASMLTAAAHAFAAVAVNKNKNPFKIQALFNQAVKEGVKKAVEESLSETELEGVKELEEIFKSMFKDLDQAFSEFGANMKKDGEKEGEGHVHVHSWEGSYEDFLADEDIPPHLKEQIQRQMTEKVIPFNRMRH